MRACHQVGLVGGIAMFLRLVCPQLGSVGALVQVLQLPAGRPEESRFLFRPLRTGYGTVRRAASCLARACLTVLIAALIKIAAQE